MRGDVVEIQNLVVFRAPVLVVLVETGDRTLLNRLGALLAAVLVRLALVLRRGVGPKVLRAPWAGAAVGRPRGAETARAGRSAVAAGSTGRPRADVTAWPGTAESAGPRGAKGTGDGGIIPVGGVIANAVASALSSLGVQPRELPLSPPRIWQLIEDARKAAQEKPG